MAKFKYTQPGKNGYETIYINGEYLWKHRYLYEQHYGVKLVEGDYIHHIDGNKRNNEISNLLLKLKGGPSGKSSINL